MRWIFVAILLSGSVFLLSTLFSISSKKDGSTLKEVAEDEENKAIAQIKTAFDLLFTEAKKREDDIELKGEDYDQINFLFLGVGGEEHISGNYLTDTIILSTLIPSSGQAAVISIPRDLMVRSPDGTYFTRINALYSIPPASPGQDIPAADPHGEIYNTFPGPMGVEYTKEAVENITGIEADYYAVLDLAGIEKIVDILGGINVRRSEEIYDTAFPDDNFGYETYKIKEGWRYLNGEEAVKYIRTRHTSGGDFDRMKRQQEVTLSIKKKVEGLQSLSSLPKFFSLYNALEDHFTTDLTFEEILHLMDIGKNISNDRVVFERITALPAEAGQEGGLPAGQAGLLVPKTVIWGGKEAYVLVPRAGVENYKEIRNKVANIIESLK